MDQQMSINDDHALETYKSLISFGTEALRAFQLLNGGAIVALLAYLGQAKLPYSVQNIFAPLAFFVVGLSLGTLCFLGAYLTQFALFNESVRPENYSGRKHTFWLWITLVVAGLSLASFVVGAVCGVRALTNA
jgi:hypothetical protein